MVNDYSSEIEITGLRWRNGLRPHSSCLRQATCRLAAQPEAKLAAVEIERFADTDFFSFIKNVCSCNDNWSHVARASSGW
jgi:hypothetical protein